MLLFLVIFVCMHAPAMMTACDACEIFPTQKEKPQGPLRCVALCCIVLLVFCFASFFFSRNCSSFFFLFQQLAATLPPLGLDFFLYGFELRVDGCPFLFQLCNVLGDLLVVLVQVSMFPARYFLGHVLCNLFQFALLMNQLIVQLVEGGVESFLFLLEFLVFVVADIVVGIVVVAAGIICVVD